MAANLEVYTKSAHSPRGRLARCLEQATATLLLIACATLTLLRCHYGVDTADEAQYVGQAYMSLIGGAPFLTDLFMQQVVSIILTPALRIYLTIRGDTDGMVIAFRIMWWMMAVATTFIIFRRVSSHIPPISAALTSSLIVVFIPFTIPSPSYNTIAILLLTLGLCTTSFLSISQIASLLGAALIYPPMGLVLTLVLLSGLFRRAHYSQAVKSAVLCIVATGFIGILAWAVLPKHSIANAFVFSNFFRAASMKEKLELWARQLPEILNIFSQGTTVSNHFIILILGAFGSLFACLKLKTPLLKSYLLISLAAGFLSAWASSNGLLNFAIGGFPSLLLSVIVFQAWCQHLLLPSFIKAILRNGLPAGILCIFYLHTWTAAYSEPSLASLTTPMTSGPYKGLYTTPSKAEFLHLMQNKVRSFDDGRSSVLFLYDFAAGYLLSNMRPETRMLYLHKRLYSDEIRKLLLPIAGQYPDYVIYAGKDSLHGGDPILNDTYSARSGPYKEVERSDTYLIYRLKGN